MSDGDPQSTEMSCPRCGYELAGMMASWNTACPLQGTCTECGYQIDFSELHARGNVPDWFVGVAPHAWGWIRRLPGTVLRMAVPFWAWRTLRLFAFNSSFGTRQVLAWSAAMVVFLPMMFMVALVLPVEGWNIVHDIEGRVALRDLARKRISERERILGPDAGPWVGDDWKVESVLEGIDDPMAIPLGAARDSLKRLWTMARFADVPRGEGFELTCSNRGEFSTLDRNLLSRYSDSSDPWKSTKATRPIWSLMVLLPMVMVGMSGFGLRISRGFDRSRAWGWIQFRLALLSTSILFPLLLLLGVQLAMSDGLAMQARWSKSARDLMVIPLLCTGGGLLLLAVWWWGAYRMLQVRFAMLTAFLMVFLLSIASMLLVPSLFLLYDFLTGGGIV